MKLIIIVHTRFFQTKLQKNNNPQTTNFEIWIFFFKFTRLRCFFAAENTEKFGWLSPHYKMKLFAKSSDSVIGSNMFKFSINQSVAVVFVVLFFIKILVMKLYLCAQNTKLRHRHQIIIIIHFRHTHSNVEMSIFDICTHLCDCQYATAHFRVVFH